MNTYRGFLSSSPMTEHMCLKFSPITCVRVFGADELAVIGEGDSLGSVTDSEGVSIEFAIANWL